MTSRSDLPFFPFLSSFCEMGDMMLSDGLQIPSILRTQGAST